MPRVVHWFLFMSTKCPLPLLRAIVIKRATTAVSDTAVAIASTWQALFLHSHSATPPLPPGVSPLPPGVSEGAPTSSSNNGMPGGLSIHSTLCVNLGHSSILACKASSEPEPQRSGGLAAVDALSTATSTENLLPSLEFWHISGSSSLAKIEVLRKACSITPGC